MILFRASKNVNEYEPRPSGRGSYSFIQVACARLSGLTDRSGRLLAAEHGERVVCSEYCHGGARLDGGRAEVRHECHILQIQQLGVDLRLFLEEGAAPVEKEKEKEKKEKK